MRTAERQPGFGERELLLSREAAARGDRSAAERHRNASAARVVPIVFAWLKPHPRDRDQKLSFAGQGFVEAERRWVAGQPLISMAKQVARSRWIDGLRQQLGRYERKKPIPVQMSVLDGTDGHGDRLVYEPEGREPSPDAIAEQRDAAAWVLARLGEIDGPGPGIVVATAGGLTFTEAARRAGRTDTWAHDHHARAIRRLREMRDEEGVALC